MQAIVVTFDRLATRLLGCYGNEWIETPHLDRLASQGAVFDQHFVESVASKVGTSWLTGQHSLHSASQSAPLDLMERLHAAQVRTSLITTADTSSAVRDARFERCEFVHGFEGFEASPNDVSIARIVQSAVFSLQEKAESRLLWLHAPEPSIPPEGFATLYFEDFEERGETISQLPREEWGKHLAVAGGSVSLVDHWLGVLLGEVDRVFANEPTLILMAADGSRAWMDDFIASSPTVRRASPAEALRDQETRAPLIIAVRQDERFRPLSGIRCSYFSQPRDIYSTILEWFGVKTPGLRADAPAPATHLRQSVREITSCLQLPLLKSDPQESIWFGDGDKNFGIRTRKWSCLTRLSDPSKRAISSDPSSGTTLGDEATAANDPNWPEQVQLFEKPNDIWDVTDISTQYPGVCRQLLWELDQKRFGNA